MKTIEEIETESEIRIMNKRVCELFRIAWERGESKGLPWHDSTDAEVDELHLLQDQVIEMGGKLEIN